MKSLLIIRFLIMSILLVSCAAPSTQVIPTITSSPVPTPKPTETVPPTAKSLPGFEGWSVLNPQAVDIAAENGSLILTLKFRVLWFMSQRGVLVHKPVSGSFKITADVDTSKNSDQTQPPGGDGSVQLGGLMARNGNGGKENYVFIVVGDDGNGLSVETKNMVDNFSEYNGPGWDSSAAELRLCRFGSTFHLFKRQIGLDEPWELAASFERPDLPETLQVGPNIYTDSTPDLRVRFEHLRIESVSAETDCEKD